MHFALFVSASLGFAIASLTFVPRKIPSPDKVASIKYVEKPRAFVLATFLASSGFNNFFANLLPLIVAIPSSISSGINQSL